MNLVTILSGHYLQSFNHILATRFHETLLSHGHRNEIIDLYAINFQAVMKGDDFNQFFNKEMPQEIRDYQDKIQQADCLAFFYPVWWNDMPAIMKGWIDRVFSKGFAYAIDGNKAIGLLNNKKAVLFATLGNSETDPYQHELENAMRIKEAKGVFHYCGFSKINHYFFYNVYASEEKRRDIIANVTDIAQKIHLI